MRPSTLVRVEEYLSTDYSPDCDYVEGEVQERNAGEYEHGKWQAELIIFLAGLRRKLGFHIVPEQRLQVKPRRFRVPDICVILGPEPQEQVLTNPPFLCIEILSPEDRMVRI
ncbi:MAG: Uma2 family endonuclease, partial [Acidobacteriota bacterium]